MKWPLFFIDISRIMTPLGRWRNVGKSCEEILQEKDRRKWRTIMHRRFLERKKVKENFDKKSNPQK